MPRFYTTEKISENIEKTPEGFLICHNVPITRVGSFEYRDGEVPIMADAYGRIVIKRTADEVFNEDTIASFEGKPITIDHPEDFVDPENWAILSNGHSSNVRKGDGAQADLLIADLLITTKAGIDWYDNGGREISCGYDAEYDEIKPGVGRQYKIVGNHIALVERGRAGKRCSIRDSACTDCGNCTCGKDKKQEDKKMNFKDKVNSWKKKVMKTLDEAPMDPEKVEDEGAEGLEDRVGVVEDALAELVEKEPATKDDDNDVLGRLSALEEGQGRIEVLLKTLVGEEQAEAGDEDIANHPGRLDDTEGALSEVVNDEDEDSLVSRVARLEDLCAELVGGGTEETEAGDELPGDEEGLETAMNDALEEGDEEKAKLIQDKLDDLKEGGEKEETGDKKRAKDSKTKDSWLDVAKRAEVLFPGIELKRSTKDSDFMGIKAAALKGAASRPEAKSLVQAMTKGKAFRSMDNATLDAAFYGASEVLMNKLGEGLVASKFTHDKRIIYDQVKDINARNKEFFKTKK